MARGKRFKRHPLPLALPHPGFKSGTFYLAEKRNFLLCVDRSPEVHPGLCKKPCRQAIQTISEPRGTFQKWESGHYHCAINDIQGKFQNSERKLGERIIAKRARTDIGAEKNYCPFLSLASQTIFPPTIVVTTLTSRIFAGSMAKMSSLSRTMSASLPVVIEPFSLS